MTEIAIRLTGFDERDFLHVKNRLLGEGYDLTDTELWYAKRVGLESWYISNQHRGERG